jgi:hypothetical protein
MSQRRDEPPAKHSRSDRVVMARGRWFITTRERMDIGPYTTKEAAEKDAKQLSDALDGIDDPVVVLALIREFIRRREII